jgi:hypothetical protein
MKTNKQKFMYKGKLEEYQIYAKQNTVTEYQSGSYTEYQNYLYNRALNGLRALSKDELETLNNKKKQRITRVYVKAQTAINLYKQSLTNKITNRIFDSLFPQSPIAEFFKQNTEVDSKFKNKLKFKELGIEKEDIIELFISQGILPRNFRDLKTDPNRLPRLKNES